MLLRIIPSVRSLVHQDSKGTFNVKCGTPKSPGCGHFVSIGFRKEWFVSSAPHKSQSPKYVISSEHCWCNRTQEIRNQYLQLTLCGLHKFNRHFDAKNAGFSSLSRQDTSFFGMNTLPKTNNCRHNPCIHENSSGFLSGILNLWGYPGKGKLEKKYNKLFCDIPIFCGGVGQSRYHAMWAVWWLAQWVPKQHV